MDIKKVDKVYMQRENEDVPFKVNVTINKLNSTKYPSQTLCSYQTLGDKNRSLPNRSITKNKSRCNLFKKTTKKGMSSFSFCRAGMTVEAAIVLPLFLLCFLNLFSIIEIYRLHSNLTAALRETGSKMAVYAYAYEKVIGEEKTDSEMLKLMQDIGFSLFYVKGQVEEYCGKEYLEAAPIEGGPVKLNYLFSDILGEDDQIDLVVTYRVTSLSRFMGFTPRYNFCRYYGRAWTGYDVEKPNKNTDNWCYISEFSSVYHKSRECSHLRINLYSCVKDDLENRRNQYGERYRPCEKCCKGVGEICFICVYGNRYHEDRECSGLKRMVRVIPMQEAIKKYPPCKDCGR